MTQTGDHTRDTGELTLVDHVVREVRAVDGVHDLHSGVLGEVATYLPGRKVAGVRVRESATETSEVHIVLDWGSPALATADAVRARVEALVPGPVHVVVEDIAVPSSLTPDSHPDSHPEQEDLR